MSGVMVGDRLTYIWGGPVFTILEIDQLRLEKQVLFSFESDGSITSMRWNTLDGLNKSLMCGTIKIIGESINPNKIIKKINFV